jgi:hypothetical protein
VLLAPGGVKPCSSAYQWKQKRQPWNGRRFKTKGKCKAMSFTSIHDAAQAPLSKVIVVDCLEWRPCERNTLRGFAKVKVVPWGLVLDGVAVHKKNDRQWAQLPSRPQLDKDGVAMRDESGKIKYAKMIEIDGKREAWAFSDAVVAAVARKAGAQ